MVFLLLFAESVLGAFGQDPEFSQFYSNPLYLNPGFTGTTSFPRINLNYRNQSPHNGETFTSYSISFDRFSKTVNGGLGFQLVHDRELNNVIQTNCANMFYSYHIKINDWSFVSAGLQAGITYKSFDPGHLIFPTMINQLSGEIIGSLPDGFERGSTIFPDFAVGVVGQIDDIFWGVSVHHLTKPDESIIKGDQTGRLPRKVTFHLGARSHKLHNGLLSREFTFSPNIIYQQQGSFKQLNLGFYMIEKSITFGAWYRNNISLIPDALIALIGISKEKFKFGYSFDWTLSKLSNYSYGSHEVSLVFFFGKHSGASPREHLQIPPI